MRYIPWITLAATVIFFISPPGQDLIHQSFYSGEQLARSIGQLLFVCFIGGAIVLSLVEYGVRFYLHRRRRRAANG